MERNKWIDGVGIHYLGQADITITKDNDTPWGNFYNIHVVMACGKTRSDCVNLDTLFHTDRIKFIENTAKTGEWKLTAEIQWDSWNGFVCEELDIKDSFKDITAKYR